MVKLATRDLLFGVMSQHVSRAGGKKKRGRSRALLLSSGLKYYSLSSEPIFSMVASLRSLVMSSSREAVSISLRNCSATCS